MPQYLGGDVFVCPPSSEMKRLMSVRCLACGTENVGEARVITLVLSYEV